MKFELTQEFYFEAAHTLDREIDAEASRRIHGHTYHAEVSAVGVPDPKTGMLIDLAKLQQLISDVRDQLDHRFLDDVAGLGVPTLERLCEYIAKALTPSVPTLTKISVARRASGDRCTLYLD